MSDGQWIAHTPGPCPVPPETTVEVRWQDDSDRRWALASVFYWGACPIPITHYRIVAPAPSAGPVRMVTRPKIVPRMYGRVHVKTSSPDFRQITLELTKPNTVGGYWMTAPELRAAAKTLSQLADAMEQESKL